ncbi:GntR family transcriptional regulator [Yinghuangia aomiensis]
MPLRADTARRIAGVLRRQILRGGVRIRAAARRASPGAGEFAASRNAVRDALRVLADEGLVERRRECRHRRPVRPYRHPIDELAGLAEALRRHGRVENRVRAAHPLPAPPAVAHRLQLPPDHEVVYLERLRLLDGQPVSLDCTYLAPEVGTPLLRLPRRNWRTTHVFHPHRGPCTATPWATADVTVQAVTADTATARVLGMPAPGALLLVERLTRLGGGRPVDLEYLHVRAATASSPDGTVARGGRRLHEAQQHPSG